MSTTLPDTGVAPSSNPTRSTDEMVLVPTVSRALWVWDTLALELGDVALVTSGNPHAELLAVVATWYGAQPVLRLSRATTPPPPGIEGFSFDDPQGAIKTLSGRLAGRPGVAAVDLSGRSDIVEVLLESLPTFSRLLLAGTAREPLTIDFYNNVHRKGLDLHSGVFDPSLERDDDPICGPRLERAARLLQHPGRTDACRAAIAASSLGSAQGD